MRKIEIQITLGLMFCYKRCNVLLKIIPAVYIFCYRNKLQAFLPISSNLYKIWKKIVFASSLYNFPSVVLRFISIALIIPDCVYCALCYFSVLQTLEKYCHYHITFYIVPLTSEFWNLCIHIAMKMDFTLL